LIATHSTEIVSEAETEDIVVINKKRRRPIRITNPSQLEDVFKLLGSNVNPILTQLAKTRRVVFVEGKDFQILSRFARKLGLQEVAGRSSFAVVPAEGFNPERMRSLKKGMETTLGVAVAAAVLLDRDYRSSQEKAHLEEAMKHDAKLSIIHDCKEIENFLLVPDAIDRAVVARLRDRKARTGEEATYVESAREILEQFAEARKHYVAGQYAGLRRQFERDQGSKLKDETILEEEHRAFEARWKLADERLAMIPGKDAISYLNGILQETYNVTVTSTGIIDAMKIEEIPAPMKRLLNELAAFSKEVLG
jgi:hypothetical protein